MDEQTDGWFGNPLGTWQKRENNRQNYIDD